MATAIGLNEAIVLQQVHFWIEIKKNLNQDFFDGHYWVYNTYENWQKQIPFLSLSTIRRTFSSLEKSGFLISGNYNKVGFDRTKWYTIDYDVYEKAISEYFDSNPNRSNWTDGSVQNDQTNTIDYTETTIKGVKTKFYTQQIKGVKPKVCTTQSAPNNPVKNYIDISNTMAKISCNRLMKQGIRCNHEEIEKIVDYYYLKYEELTGNQHPIINQEAMDRVVENICTHPLVNVYVDDYKLMIDKHFKTKYEDCDYNICHFASEGILSNRFYETCY